ncbi:hypothetical protein [Flocculibacter collagenilyticus]|uniref:hypothetical protein n=1 Tax=Flocculibacter collagenilyticus TaxID=2744479 RepID=UPI0018F556B7|nr:hypothetical protein [Flocculibacter collagenilyticus]
MANCDDKHSRFSTYFINSKAISLTASIFLTVTSLNCNAAVQSRDITEDNIRTVTELGVARLQNEFHSVADRRKHSQYFCITAHLFNKFSMPETLGRINQSWSERLFESQVVNIATTLPDNTLVAFTGSLSQLSGQDEIAGLLALALAEAKLGYTTSRFLAQDELIRALLIIDNRKEALHKRVEDGLMPALGLDFLVDQTAPLTAQQRRKIIEEALLIMARTGFYPKALLNVFKKLNKEEGSTFAKRFPSPSSQINYTRKFLPAAMKHYKQVEKNERVPSCERL